MSNIDFFQIPVHTKEWYDFRKGGIGGSEMGNILAPFNESPMKIWSEKVGITDPKQFDNERMFHGRNQEDYVRDLWQYYDGSTEGMMQNYMSGKMIREAKTINSYAVNKKFPWMFGSVDGLIPSGCARILDGTILEKDAILEVKTLDTFAASKWIGRIPLYYLIQVHVYMIIFETDYAEIAILEGGNKFRCEPIEKNERLIDQILTISHDFWYKRVVPARKVFEKRELSSEGKEYEKYDLELQKLEPEPDNTEACKQFMEERFRKESEAIRGNMSDFKKAIKHRNLTCLKNRIDEERDLVRNQLIKKFVDSGVERINFGDEGYLRYYKKKNTETYQLDNRVVKLLSDSEVENIFNKIKL
jgi:putative phage-type endonuclease